MINSRFQTISSSNSKSTTAATTRSRWSAICYRFTLFVLILLITVILLAALYDLTSQLFISSRPSRVSDVIISLGVYPVLAIIVLFITISRKLSFRNDLASIPKGYLPVKSDDVPKEAFELISNEYDRASVIAHISEPSGRRQRGWGRPGTEYEGVFFRTSILDTIPVVETALAHLLPSNPTRSRSAPLSPLAPLLNLSPSPIPSPLSPVISLYEQHLTRAKYGRDEPTEEMYIEVIKIVAVLVGILSKRPG